MIQSILYHVFLNILGWVPISKVKVKEGKLILLLLLISVDIFYLYNLPQK